MGASGVAGTHASGGCACCVSGEASSLRDPAAPERAHICNVGRPLSSVACLTFQQIYYSNRLHYSNARQRAWDDPSANPCCMQ